MPATKDEIADRFWRHVEHYGFAKTSVEEVARELGISKTTIYQHFSGKDDILHYVIQNAATHEAARVEQEYAGLPTYWDRLERLVRENVLRTAREWLAGHTEAEAKHQYELGGRIARQTYDSLVRRWVAEGADAGEFRPIAADEAITSRFIGAVLLDAVEQIREDRDRHIDDAVVEAVRKLLT